MNVIPLVPSGSVQDTKVPGGKLRAEVAAKVVGVGWKAGKAEY